jgi:hypothetical protein
VTLFWAATLIAIIIAPRRDYYNRASARLCYPGATEAGRVGGRGNVRIRANCSLNPQNSNSNARS